jgi:hypothetical protein
MAKGGEEIVIGRCAYKALRISCYLFLVINSLPLFSQILWVKSSGQTSSSMKIKDSIFEFEISKVSKGKLKHLNKLGYHKFAIEGSVANEPFIRDFLFNKNRLSSTNIYLKNQIAYIVKSRIKTSIIDSSLFRLTLWGETTFCNPLLSNSLSSFRFELRNVLPATEAEKNPFGNSGRVF